MGPCEPIGLGAAAKAIEERAAAWSPALGTMPDFSFDAISAVWKHCPDLPDEAKRLLDASVDHSSMPSLAELAAAEGRPAPAVNDDPLDAELRGHAAFHGVDEAATKAAWAWRATLCPSYSVIALEAGALPASERGALFWSGCLDRFDLMTRDEYLRLHGSANVGFALHRWLIDGGVDPAVARPLGRAVELGRHWMMEGRDRALRLPAAEVETRVEDGLIVAVEEGAIALGGRAVERFDPSHGPPTVPSVDGEPIVSSLVDALTEEREHGRTLAERRGQRWDAFAVVLVDRALTWSVLRPVVASADAAGFERVAVFGLANERIDPLRVVVIHDAAATGAPLTLPESASVQALVDTVLARAEPVQLVP